MIKKKHLPVCIFLIVWIIVGVSCSSSVTATEAPSTPKLPSKAAATPKSVPTPISNSTEPGYVFDWSIKTGELIHVGVNKDGNIYGIGENLYAVISGTGEVIQANEIDLHGCARDNFVGGSWNVNLDTWFVVKPDGSIVSNAKSGPTCVILPGDPPNVEKHDLGYFPYADDLTPRGYPSIPERFESLGSIGGKSWGAILGEVYRWNHRLSDYDIYVTRQLCFDKMVKEC